MSGVLCLFRGFRVSVSFWHDDPAIAAHFVYNPPGFIERLEPMFTRKRLG